MRTRTIFLALFLGAACSPAPQVSVYRLGVGDRSAGLQGDPVKVRKPPQDPYAGSQRGYFVVRTGEDWSRTFSDARAPAMPASLDTSRSMLLLAAPDSNDVVDVKMTKVLESTGFVHVWVRETMRGQGCVARPGDRSALEAVLVPRIEKPVKFYVEEERGESCGEPPRANVRCRQGGAPQWASSVEGQPGDVIDCVMTAETHGKFSVIDRALLLGSAPIGSTAKLAYDKGPTHGTFRIDVFGDYKVRGEATDDSGRKSEAELVVHSAPPKSKDAFVQLVWTGFDASDDPDTFPRLTLGARVGTHECSLDKQPPDLCAVKRFGAYTMMTLHPTAERADLTVRYVDERVEGGPVACVEVWFDGERTTQVCDRQHRQADEQWAVGALETATGKLVEAGGATPADAGADAAPKKQR